MVPFSLFFSDVFLLSACQEKDPPLKYLFEDDHQVADSATLVYKLFTNDTVQ